MNNFFTKLNVNFDDLNFDNLNLTFLKGYKTRDDFREIVKINYTDDDFQDVIRSRLPVGLGSMIRSVRITYITDSPPPHRDHGGYVCINYYLETGQGPTTFYTAGPDATPMIAVGQTTANEYTFDGLTRQASFVATPNSCYILNIGEIHTIDVEPDSVRKILQLTFEPTVTYSMVREKCHELGLVVET